MGGRHKKLQDFFADLKIPRRERSRVPLLVAPEGILWVVGYRTDHRFCARSSSGRRLVAELVDGHSLQGESR
jgi:tRNA(Ile)-lysidine synthase